MVTTLLAGSPHAGDSLLAELRKRATCDIKLRVALASSPRAPHLLADIVRPRTTWSLRPYWHMTAIAAVLAHTTNRTTIAHLLDTAQLGSRDLLTLLEALPADAAARAHVHTRLSKLDARMPDEARLELLTDPATPVLARERYLKAAAQRPGTQFLAIAYALTLLTPKVRDRVGRRLYRELNYPLSLVDRAADQDGDLPAALVRDALLEVTRGTRDVVDVVQQTGHPLAAQFVLDDPDADDRSLLSVAQHPRVLLEQRLTALLRSRVRGVDLLGHSVCGTLLTVAPADFLNAHLIELLGRAVLCGHPCLGRADLDARTVDAIWQLATRPPATHEMVPTRARAPMEHVAVWVATHPATAPATRRAAAHACAESVSGIPSLAVVRALTASAATWGEHGPATLGGYIPVGCFERDTVWFQHARQAGDAWLAQHTALRTAGPAHTKTLLALVDAEFPGTLSELLMTASSIAA